MVQTTAIDRLRTLALVVLRMAVGEAVVEAAGVANDGNQLAFLTLGSVAAVREHLLTGLRLAVLWGL
jgi:hypothetical protein